MTSQTSFERVDEPNNRTVLRPEQEQRVLELMQHVKQATARLARLRDELARELAGLR